MKDFSKNIVTLNLLTIQPSQLYISQKKLNSIQVLLSKDELYYDPIIVKELEGKITIVDGHTRAYALYAMGMKTINAIWETDDLDWDAYKICVNWCHDEHIVAISDLAGRIIGHSDYEVLWYERCRAMHESLEKSR